MKKNILRMSVTGLILLLMAACKPAEIPTEPVFEEAWIRQAPPGMKMTAGFGTLRNVTDQAIDIESFSSPILSSVSLHRTEVVDGVSSMHEVDVFSLAPGSSLVMEPGGYHLMMSFRMQLSPARPVPLQVHTTDGRTFSFEMPVEQR